MGSIISCRLIKIIKSLITTWWFFLSYEFFMRFKVVKLANISAVSEMKSVGWRIGFFIWNFPFSFHWNFIPKITKLQPCLPKIIKSRISRDSHKILGNICKHIKRINEHLKQKIVIVLRFQKMVRIEVWVFFIWNFFLFTVVFPNYFKFFAQDNQLWHQSLRFFGIAWRVAESRQGRRNYTCLQDVPWPFLEKRKVLKNFD